jgi:DNA-binding XRE family transcriptional regulator
MSFALKNQLVECLAEKKIRQWQLARRLRMSRAYVCRLCSGQIQPSMVAALRIAHCVGKPVEQVFQLVEGDTNQGSSPSNFTAAPARPMCNKPAAPPACPAGVEAVTDRSLVGPAAKVVASLSRSKPKGKT